MTEAARSLLGTRILGVFTALMTALAAGAVWCVLVLFAQRDLIILAVFAAIAIAWVMRSHAFAGLRSGALIAIVMTVVACAYSLYLQSAAYIAGLLGMSFREALPRLDPGMASAIAWYNIGPIDLTVLVLSPLLAAWLVLRPQR